MMINSQNYLFFSYYYELYIMNYELFCTFAIVILPRFSSKR